VASAKVSVITGCDSPPELFPEVAEMVRVEGRKGLFTVLGVDPIGATADVSQRVGPCNVEKEQVELKLIRRVPGQASSAIQEFLSSGATPQTTD